MNQNMTQLNRLIEITRYGQHFYQHALDVVQDVELQHLFRDMAQAKTHVIQALSVKVAAHQERPASGGTTAANADVNRDAVVSSIRQRKLEGYATQLLEQARAEARITRQ